MLFVLIVTIAAVSAAGFAGTAAATDELTDNTSVLNETLNESEHHHDLSPDVDSLTTGGPSWGDIEANVTATSITRAIIEIDDEPPDTESFVAYELDEDGNRSGLGRPIYQDGLELELPGLLPETHYNMTVEAVDEDDNVSDDGPEIEFETDDLDDFGWPSNATLDVTETTGLTATVTWPEAEPPADILFYYLIITEPSDPVPITTPTFQRGLDGNFTGGPGNLTLDDGEFTYETADVLDPETEYNFEMSASVSFEDSTGPLFTTATTGNATVPEWPEDAALNITEKTGLATTMTWPEADPSGDIQSYNLVITEAGETVPVTEPTMSRDADGNFTADEGNVTLDDGEFTYETADVLDPETEYDFEMTAQLGPEDSDPLNATATTGDVDPPEWDDSVNGTVTGITEDSATIEVDDYPISSDSFETLVFFDENGTEFSTTVFGDLEHQLVDLSSNTTYEVTVEVEDTFGGVSSDGPTLTVTTSGAEPPSNFDAEGHRTNVSLSWTGPNTGTYVISRDGSVVGTVDADNKTGWSFTYEDSGLEAETHYEYELTREVDGGVSEPVSDNATTGLISATALASGFEDGSPGFAYERVELSGDGQYVAYSAAKIFRHNVTTGEREEVSVYGPEEFTFETPFRQPSISDDGNEVAFVTKDGTNQVYVRDIGANETTLVSYFEDEFGDIAEGDGPSENPTISGDGRYVAFESTATELVNDDVEGANLYVYDRNQNEMELIPVENTELGMRPDISPDGDVVVFESDNQNLTDRPDDVPDDQENVFLYDRSTEEFEWVSEPNDGGVPDDRSTRPAAAEDGDYVAFQSYADNLTDDDTEFFEIYRYNRSAQSIDLVSVDNDGEIITSTSSPAITPDGRYIAFNSYRVDMDTGVTSDFGYNNTGDPWEWSFSSGSPAPQDISISDDGTQVGYRIAPFGVNVPNLVFNDDGSNDAYVTFLGNDSVLEPSEWDDQEVETSDVLAGELNLSWDGLDDAKYYAVFVDDELRTTTSRQTTEVTVGYLEQDTEYEFRVEALNERGVFSVDGPSTNETMANLTAPSVRTNPYDVAVGLHWSDDSIDDELWSADVYRDGEYVGSGDIDTMSFLDDDQLSPNTTYDYEIEFWDAHYNNATALATATTLPRGSGIETEALDRDEDGDLFDGRAWSLDTTPDGDLVAIASNADPLGLPEDAASRQIYLRDSDDDSIELISRPDGSGSDDAGDGFSWEPQISKDGTEVIFRSASENLDDDIPDISNRQLYVRDRVGLTTQLLTQNDSGEAANARIRDFDVSRDGSRIVFRTDATNLVDDITDDDRNQAIVYDRDTGEMTLASQGIDGQPADDWVNEPAISADGEYVAFRTAATNLVENVTNDQTDVYRYEVATGELERVSVTPDGNEIPHPDPGNPPGDNAFGVAITEDGSEVGFLSQSEALGSNGEAYRIFIWDNETGVTEMVEANPFGLYGVDTDEGLSFSPDGRFVAFASETRTMVPREKDFGDLHLYVHDRTQPYTMRADVNSSGERAETGEFIDSEQVRLADTDVATLLYTSPAANLDDDTDGARHAFRTELTRFDAVADVDPPSWPPDAELETTPLGQTSIALEWPEPVHELGADSYVVDIEGVSENLTVSGGESGVTVDDLESNTTYTFDVYAVDATDQTSPALTANETTLADDDLVSLLAEADGGAVSLEWPPADEGSDIDGYVVQNRELTGESAGNWTDRLTIEDRETATANDTGLVENTTYEYRVLGVDTAGERVPYSTNATVEMPALAVDQAVWQVIDGDRVGSNVSPESTIGVTLIGEQNWNATGTVTYDVWDDPADDAPETETMNISFEEDSNEGGHYEANFTLAPKTATVTDIEATLTNGESDAETQVENLPLTVFANLTLDTDWPADVEFPENARLDIWNESLQDGDTKTFDEERAYSFEQVDAGVDGKAEYRIRVRDRFTGQELFEVFEPVRGGLATNETIDDPLEPATLNVSVVDPSGDSASARIHATDLGTDRNLGSVAFSEGDGFRPIASGSRLLAGEEIELTIGGQTSEPYRFNTTKTVELESGANNATFELEDWGENVTVSGVVTDDDGTLVDGADVSAIQRYGEQRWSGFSYTTTTDADGEYELSVRPEGNLSVSVTHQPEDGIRNVAEPTIVVGSDSVEKDIELETQRERTIELESIVYDVPGAEDPVTLELSGANEAAGLMVTITDDDNVWRAERRAKYPYSGLIADDAQVELCAQTTSLGISGTHCEKFVVDEDDTDIGIELNLTDEEDATVSGVVTADLRAPDGDQWDRNASDDTTGWNARLYEEQDGEYEPLRTFDGSDGDVSFNLPDEGEYRLRFVGDYLGVSQFTETTFELSGNETQKHLGNVSMDSEGRFGFQSGNTVTGPSEPLMSGGDGTLRANYENSDDGSVSDVEVSVDLPDALSYVDESIVHTGDATVDEDDVVVDDGTVTLPLGTIETNESGTIRLDVQADSEAEPQDVEVPATISFDDGGHETEWLGSADVPIGALTLSAPSQVGTHEIEASGRAPAESTVGLYAGFVRIGETTAAPNGLWQLSTDLPEEDPEHEYDLRATAQAENETQESATTVTYSPGDPQLENVRFRQSDDPDEVDNLPPVALANIDAFLPATSEWVSFTPGANTRFPRTMLAGLTFEFELEFDRPEDVENAYVFVDGPAGGIGGVNDTSTLQEGAGENGVFTIPVPTDRRAPWSLGPICVAQNLPGDVIPPTGSNPPDRGVLSDVDTNPSAASTPQGGNVVDNIPSGFIDECTPIGDPAWKIDPSGYVYEVERNNTISNVTATVFEKDETGEYVEWDAEWWGEENPQQTDAAGWYGWDVPEGDWRVVYEKDGYETAYSQDIYGPIEVPPPRFDVDIPLKSLEPPEVESVTHDTDDDTVTIEFNRHVDIATVSENTVFVESLGNDSERLDADIVFPETVENPHTESDDETLTQEVRLEVEDSLEDGDYQVVVRDLVESYAEVPLSETMTESLDLEPGLATYADEDGVVETDGLLDAISDWRGDDIDTDLLLDVINAWRSGEDVT